MNWNKFRLEQLCIKVQSGGTPSTSIADYYGGTIDWIKTKEVNFCKIYEAETKITELGLSKSSAKIIPENSIIIAMYGNGDTAGRCAMNLIPVATNQACCNLTFNEEVANPYFMFYKISSHYRDFVNLKSGGAQLNLNSQRIKEFEVILPPLETQKQIANILSTHDQLIENNLKRIKLLEETTQNIYKEWFVNFRFPNYEHTVFDAVSGLPVGWERIKLEEIAKLIHGYAFDAKRFTEEPTAVMVLRMGNFKEKGGLQLDKNVKYISKEYDFREKFKLYSGDLIIVLSDVTRDGRIIGNVGILPDYGIEYALNQRVAKLECDDKIKTYLYSALNSFDFKEHCKPRANGATVLNLKSIDVNEYKIVVPSESIVESYSAIINPLLKIMENLDLQNQKLKEARDILLPRLMNRTLEI